jgi:tRNA G18 (ribose-2'-O)-methylase SpoU
MRASKTIDIVGRNSVADALTSDKQFVMLYVEASSKADPKVQEILKTAQGKNVSIEVVDSEELDKRFETNTQGVVLVVDPGEMISLKEILAKKRDPLIIMFNRLDYEQNLGAILRTAWGSDVDAVTLTHPYS